MFVFICISALIVAVSCEGFCGNKNEYQRLESSCDNYIECIESQEFQRLCPDGMNFNPEATWPDYPCAYPGDVACAANDVLQADRASLECPRDYGFFKSPLATPTNCGKYRQCVGGVAIEMDCPVGLAFNPEIGRCDWAPLVPSCNAAEFLSFNCPPGSVDQYGYDVTENFEIPGKCYSFIACFKGGPRLLSCDLGFKFDSSVNRCVNSNFARGDTVCEERPKYS